jgi:dihydroorotate dehydrogenase
MTGRAQGVVSEAVLPVLLRWDPERAHDWGLLGLRCLRPFWRPPEARPGSTVRIFGLEFSHPLGLAAGFDKNGDYLEALGALGFSHIELGTVTPRPQPGNPKPRMFRAPGIVGLVNRMGFNNKGVDHLVARLARARYAGIRGVSIGKNADTPLEQAAQDYLACLDKVYAFADYVAVNISSPNTARLRELQAPDGLSSIVGPLLEQRARLETQHGRRVPLLVKIAPDLDSSHIGAVAASLRSLGVDGVIATNTTTDLAALGPGWPADRRGGLSGAPLHGRSVAVIEQLRVELGKSFPIIGVGGIVDGAGAAATLRAGADLLQVYTGFAYRGPALLEEILNAIPSH